ncbi:MAG: hypothetical protein HYS41_03485 [Candidatus Omnitrophica bacterium]|nr:hypothetical protein [Candidatus Omnitrophota bacterium]
MRAGFFTLLLLASASSGYAQEVRGRVRVDGSPPAQETITIQAKSKAYPIEGCGPIQKASPKLEVSAAGGVKNAVVWAEIPAQVQPEPLHLLMDQKACVFSPHVVAAAAGQSLAIRNSDRVIHNVRIFREGRPEMLMHRWQKVDGADIVWRFDEPGRYLVRCGVHPWMYGWVFVAPGRSVAVTDEEGRFELTGLPEGRHTLRVWHETLGNRELEMEVGSQPLDLAPVVFPKKEA